MVFPYFFKSPYRLNIAAKKLISDKMKRFKIFFLFKKRKRRKIKINSKYLFYHNREIPFLSIRRIKKIKND